MNEHHPGDPGERKHTVSAAGTILDGSDESFDFRNVFIRCARVEHREPWPDGFKFAVSEYGSDFESSLFVFGFH